MDRSLLYILESESEGSEVRESIGRIDPFERIHQGYDFLTVRLSYYHRRL